MVVVAGVVHDLFLEPLPAEEVVAQERDGAGHRANPQAPENLAQGHDYARRLSHRANHDDRSEGQHGPHDLLQDGILLHRRLQREGGVQPISPPRTIKLWQQPIAKTPFCQPFMYVLYMLYFLYGTYYGKSTRWCIYRCTKHVLLG